MIPPSAPKEFRESLRLIRLQQRLTFRQLADRAKVNVTTLWRTENGRTTPKRETLTRILRALGVAV